MNFEMIAGFLRHIAGWLGAYLATVGVLPEGSAVELTTGVVLAAGAVVWSILDKKYGWTKSSKPEPTPAE
jgi:hypothetical protein